MILDDSGFSSGFDAGFSNGWFTYLGPSATPRILYGDLTTKTLAAPVFSGTIPTIEGNEGDADIITDLSTYFTGATSYSIAPAVEAGWTFDTGTGILTVTTGTVNTFGPYTVTGTNATGSDDSNAFSVVISEVVAETTRGASLPPRRVKTKLKKKDEEILEEVYRLVALSEEIDAPKEIVKQIERVEVKAKKAINIQPIIKHEKEIRQTKLQIDRIELSLKKHIKEMKEDEDAAIRALLELI